MAVNCREVVDNLREGSAPDAESRRHISACEACAREEAFWRRVREDLGGSASQPPFLHARIMAAVRAETRQREERTPWFQLPWIRRWALPASTAALVVLGEGFSMMAFFRPAPDDLVVRWSEQEAILLAQNATPISPFNETSSPGVPAAAVTPGPAGAGGLHAGLSAPAMPSAPPAASAASGQNGAGPSSDAGGTGAPAPFEMAEALAPTEPESAEPQGVFRAPAPPPAPRAMEKEERSKKDFAQDAAPADRQAKAKGADQVEAKTRRESSAPAASSVPGRPHDSAVSCRILSAGAVVGRLDLPAHAAPPPGVRWTLTVDGTGRVVSAEGATEDPGRIEALRGPVGTLQLPMGTYTLTR